MNTSIVKDRSADQAKVTPLRHRVLTAGVAAVAAGLLSMAGATHAQESQPTPPTHERHFNHGPMDPAKAAKRFDHMVNRLVPDASPEQKTKLQAIAKSTFEELRPLREKSRAAHAEGMKLLAQPTIDRNALERVRQTQQQLADQRSRITSKAFADAAEVLTPAQRVKAAEQMAKHKHHKFDRQHHRDQDKAPAPTK